MSYNYKDYYSILDVENSATQDEIKKGFRKIARKFHPDVAGSFNQEASDAKCKEANEAYEVSVCLYPLVDVEIYTSGFRLRCRNRSMIPSELHGKPFLKRANLNQETAHYEIRNYNPR